MKYLCINMKHATERRAHCQSEFNKAGIDATFIRGFDGRGSRLLHEQDWISCQVGACISHITAVEEIHHCGYGMTVIFEDDIILAPDFENKLHCAIETLPDDWHVAALCWFGGKAEPVLEAVNEDWQRFRSGDIWGQAAYLINGSKGAEAVLDCITPIRSHIDRMFWECCRDGYMNGYFLTHQLTQQRWDMPSQNQ